MRWQGSQICRFVLCTVVPKLFPSLRGGIVFQKCVNQCFVQWNDTEVGGYLVGPRNGMGMRIWKEMASSH